jgi:hypothetical protein
MAVKVKPAHVHDPSKVVPDRTELGWTSLIVTTTEVSATVASTFWLGSSMLLSRGVGD